MGYTAYFDGFERSFPTVEDLKEAILEAHANGETLEKIEDQDGKEYFCNWSITIEDEDGEEV